MFDINRAILNEQAYQLDPEGHFAHLDDWSDEVAEALATEESITLTEEHWDVIRYLRKYYLDRGERSDAREALCCLEEEFSHQGGRKYLFRLFPGGPIRQGGKIAGLPEMRHTTDSSFGSIH